MKSSIRLTPIIISIFLSACGPFVTPKPIEVSPTASAIILTYSPTKTIELAITNTPTKTIIPTETAIPVPEYYHSVDAPSLETYTTLTPEQLNIVSDDMEKHWILPDTAKDLYFADPGGTSTFPGMVINCFYGESCIGRGSVKLVNPNGGHDEWIQLWEFLEPDPEYPNEPDKKIHTIIRFYIGGPADDQYTRGLAQGKHNRIRHLKYGMPLNMFVPSTITDSAYRADPLVWGMLNGASDDDKQAHKEFDDTGILPKRFSKMIVWLREIMS